MSDSVGNCSSDPIQAIKTQPTTAAVTMAGAVHLLTRYFLHRTSCEASGVPAFVLLYLLAPR
ncbi:hypothetical protein PpBr36_01246 [Pyricularia pennisetigena]|uniref:hypothetical protein n=1 Tax=Pyricularia pennisetigena TaxID=1578925 RepID=UPI00114F7714|nr:hypothetical protein PpBr36_01246 [Pyricularia pennisetigena]TLS29713.1 hypothetical protein PpBr36_01246 [Pyricularia pennisetigena]